MGDTLYQQWGNYTAIPNTVIEMIAEIGDGAFTLALYLRYRTNHKSGNAFPSYDTIQRDTGFGRQKISEALRKLESAGLLMRRRRFNNSTVYTLVLPRRDNTSSLKIKPQQFENQTAISLKIKLEPETFNQKQLTRGVSPQNGDTTPPESPYSEQDNLPTWKAMTEQDRKRLQSAYGKYFGSPLTKGIRNAMVLVIAEGYTVDQIVEALNLSALKGKCNWNYARAILESGAARGNGNGAQPHVDDGGIVVEATWRGWTKIGGKWSANDRLTVIRGMREDETMEDYDLAERRLAAEVEREWAADWEFKRRELGK